MTYHDRSTPYEGREHDVEDDVETFVLLSKSAMIFRLFTFENIATEAYTFFLIFGMDLKHGIKF